MADVVYFETGNKKLRKKYSLYVIIQPFCSKRFSLRDMDEILLARKQSIYF